MHFSSKMNEDIVDNLSDSSAYAYVASGDTVSENETKGSHQDFDLNNKFKQFAARDRDMDEADSLSSSYIRFSGHGSTVTRQASMSYVSVDGTDTLSDTASDSENQNIYHDNDINCYSRKNCYFCLRDGNDVEATHVCQSCDTGGRFICHKCLQQHNKFCEEHDVISLSVKYERQTEPTSNPTDDRNAKNNYQTEPFESENIQLPKKDYACETDYTEDSGKTTTQESVTRDHSKVRKLKQGIAQTSKRSSYENTDSLRFFKDKLLVQVACEQTKTEDTKIVSKYGSYNIKTASDLRRCFITSMCQMDNSRLLLADCENRSLKLIQADTYKFLYSKQIEGYPNGVCELENNMAAVIVNSSKILILSIGKEIEQVAYFETGTDCNSIAGDIDGIYVCFTDKIVRYKYTGDEDRSQSKIPSEKSKKPCHFKHMSKSSDQKYIYVTDINNGIMQFDRNGILLWTIEDSKINKSTAICIDPKGIIYITTASNDTFRITKGENTEAVRIEQLQDIGEACSLCFEKTHNRLVVGQWCSDLINVFTVF